MLVIGSRGSQLALWQAQWVKARLEALGERCRIEIVHTTGDKIADVALSKAGTKGLFTKEIEEGLLNASIDVAVHSLKDLPTEVPAGLALAAIPVREDARDAVVGATLGGLRAGARIGTSSLRRSAQLRALRADLEIENIRGNVDTRLRKLDEGRYDAIVLAAAGLRRLGWQDRISDLLDPAAMCPAAGQGALAIETREDVPAFAICARLEDREARIAITAERALLAALGGGCQVPIGAHATTHGGGVMLQAVVIAPDASQVIRKCCEGPGGDAARLGRALGEELLAAGGRAILDAVYGA